MFEALFRSNEMHWLAENETKFGGQWVALDGDRLISHGPDGRLVYTEARTKGVAVPFMAFVDPLDMHHWGGWS